eukprot:contig_18961_g4667
MSVVNRWERQTEKKAKVIVTDGAKAYLGNRWDEWTADKGIEHVTTARYTPEQNDIAERYNRTVMERIVAMLAEARLDKTWWAEAAVTANYLTNRVPQRGMATTPYEAFYGKRPNVEHLRVFGCKSWAYNPKDVRNKMEPRAKVGVFVGYGRDKMGYRVRVGNEVVTSRDVFFDESLTPSTKALPTGRTNDSPAHSTAETDHNEAGDYTDLPPVVPPNEAATVPPPGPAGSNVNIDDAVAAAKRLVRGVETDDPGAQDKI